MSAALEENTAPVACCSRASMRVNVKDSQWSFEVIVNVLYFTSCEVWLVARRMSDKRQLAPNIALTPG